MNKTCYQNRPAAVSLQALAKQGKKIHRDTKPVKANLAKGSVGTKPKALPKPRSKLQKANTQVKWVTNFRMHTPHLADLVDLQLSDESVYMLGQYQGLASKIKASLANDYLVQRDLAHNTETL